MKDSNFNSIYNSMWENLKALNGKTIELITKAFPNINSGLPIVFTIEGIFSGDKTAFYYGDSEMCTETIGVVKLKLADLEELEIILPSGGIMKAPTSNLKSFIENVRIDGVNYKIENEKPNGFGNLIVLKVIKK